MMLFPGCAIKKNIQCATDFESSIETSEKLSLAKPPRREEFVVELICDFRRTALFGLFRSLKLFFPTLLTKTANIRNNVQIERNYFVGV
jgi:hypothetical protein